MDSTVPLVVMDVIPRLASICDVVMFTLVATFCDLVFAESTQLKSDDPCKARTCHTERSAATAPMFFVACVAQLRS